MSHLFEVIGRTVVDGALVSTIRLPAGLPRGGSTYETVIFAAGSGEDGFKKTYYTVSEATRGHALIVAILRNEPFFEAQEVPFWGLVREYLDVLGRLGP